MTPKARIIVTVSSDGFVNAETEGLIGGACLDYIAVLEDLLDARTVESAYTADFAKTRADAHAAEEDHDIEHA